MSLDHQFLTIIWEKPWLFLLTTATEDHGLMLT